MSPYALMCHIRDDADAASLLPPLLAPDEAAWLAARADTPTSIGMRLTAILAAAKLDPMQRVRRRRCLLGSARPAPPRAHLSCSPPAALRTSG